MIRNVAFMHFRDVKTAKNLYIKWNMDCRGSLNAESRLIEAYYFKTSEGAAVHEILHSHNLLLNGTNRKTVLYED